MSFRSPWLLVGLLAIPLLVGFYLSSQQRRRDYAVRFTNLALLGQVMGKGPGFRRHLPAILFIAGVAGLLLSIAGPQATIRIPKGQTNVMLAVDVSGSMAATDVQPTRIEAAIAAGRTLIDKLPSNAQVGLVIFNSQAQVLAPLTTDKGSVKDALGTLAPGGGTAIGDAIQVAVAQLANVADPNGPKSQNYARVVLLTDGSSNTGIDTVTAAANAAKAKIPVETIGVG
ncbi:MAG TPA: VWA domain-containing protein, partial [Candidatus Acidoferrum sp.]|nr:VWA domain-containing protein [Candidatus Acidoferrum sp.]